MSYALRAALIAGGGAGYWPDESRFDTALAAATRLAAGDLVGSIAAVTLSADHVGFKLAALLPAWLQVVLGLGYPVSLLVLALVSTANIGWIFLIARRAGADGNEALLAALAFACSTAMLYWSRHLVPYDLAVFWALGCMYVGLGPATSAWRSCCTGVLGFAAFATYNGYWTLVAVVLAMHVLIAWPRPGPMLVRAGAGLAGLAVAFAALLVLASSTAGSNLFASLRGFAGTVTQGNFDDGARIVIEYLWHADGVLSLLWLLAALATAIAVLRGKQVERRAILWLGGVLAILALLIAGSNLLEVFVVYGRLVRQLVPFLSLLLAYVVCRIALAGTRSRFLPLASVVLIAIAAWNFRAPLTQAFPREFVARGHVVMAEVRKTADPPAALQRFRFANASFLWPLPPAETPIPAGSRVLLARRHPLQFEPYLYEGYDRAQRRSFRAADLTMRLILDAPAIGAN